jgi:hypothetical protein
MHIRENQKMAEKESQKSNSYAAIGPIFRISQFFPMQPKNLKTSSGRTENIDIIL